MSKKARSLFLDPEIEAIFKESRDRRLNLPRKKKKAFDREVRLCGRQMLINVSA